MAKETINTIWPEAFEYESRVGDSDITSRDLFENTERVPFVRKLTWPTASDPILSFTIDRRTSPVEEGLKDLEEALSMAQTFFRLGALLEGHPNLGRIFVHNATGVVNGYISEPQIKVSPDVIKVSKINEWWDELNAAIELAKGIYTTLKKIELLLEKDPEIPDRETIRFIFTVSGDPEQILEEESEFKRQIRTKIRQHTRENVTITYYWK